MKREEILINDMSLCQPGKALSPENIRSHWQLVDYQAENVSGTLLLARTETAAPEITLPLNAKGWHAIYLGHLHFNGVTPLIKVKLTNDPCFREVATEAADFDQIEECFWKIADLTEQELTIGQPTRDGTNQTAGLSYVRLIPLEGKEIERYKNRSLTKRLIALHDGHGIFWTAGECSEQVIKSDIEPYRDTDYGKIFWETWLGDHAQYSSKMGEVIGEKVQCFVRAGDRRYRDCMLKSMETGFDVLQTALEHAHDVGMEFYASMRMFFSACVPHEQFEGTFFRDNPGLRCRDYDGTEVSHLSFAFPKVRNYVLKLLEDAVKYDIDGVNLILIRGEPFVLYEKSLVDSFKKETGIDPSGLGEKDARWQWYERTAIPCMFRHTHSYNSDKGKYIDAVERQRCLHIDEFSSSVQDWLRSRCRPLTEFMRGLRSLLAKKGKGRKISAVVFPNEADNMFFGLDVETWVKEGLIDILIPSAYPPIKINSESNCGSYHNIDLHFFRTITRNYDCEFYPNLLQAYRLTTQEFLKTAISYYEHGANGITFWDSNVRHSFLQQWQVIRELGHREELQKWLDTEKFPIKVQRLKRLGDYTVDRYHSNSGG